MVVAASAAFFLATNAVTNVMQEFMSFKVTQIENYAESQWGLLIDNDFATDPALIQAAQEGVEAFSRTVVRTDTEVIFAVDPAGEQQMSTSPITFSAEEQARLTSLAEQRSRKLVTIPLGGVQRVARGFFFQPFNWYVLVTERRDVFYAAVNEITYYSAAVLAAALLVAVVLLWIFSNRLTRPLGRIAVGMERIIDENDLTSRVEVEYSDETGRVAHTFNIMVGELDRAYGRIKHYALNATLAEKREHKIRNIFQKYVPQELIDRFFQNPEEMLVGDNRDLAILFSDIRGFTTISEGMRPDDLVNSLNRYFSTQVDIIMEHGGVIDKYIGDAIMAFFGAPIAHADDRYQAVLAGIEMSQALESFNAGQRAAGSPEFQIGVGIGCGEVTVGNIGTDRKMDYTVIGDVVNLASRLEGLTKVYKQKLLITGPLYQAVKDKLPVRAIDRVAVKGKSKGVSIFTAATNLKDQEAEAWQLHNTAMKYYYGRQFDHAAKALQGVLSLVPDDYVARLFLQRIEEFNKQPPPESWKGIQVMETK